MEGGKKKRGRRDWLLKSSPQAPRQKAHSKRGRGNCCPQSLLSSLPATFKPLEETGEKGRKKEGRSVHARIPARGNRKQTQPYGEHREKREEAHARSLPLFSLLLSSSGSRMALGQKKRERKKGTGLRKFIMSCIWNIPVQGGSERKRRKKKRRHPYLRSRTKGEKKRKREKEAFHRQAVRRM